MAEDFDLETPLAQIVHEELPNKIKETEGKFFALVFGGSIDDNEIVSILSGDLDNTDLVYATVNRDLDFDYVALEDWERLDLELFPELVIPFRRSIVYQG